jgi:hypothetical protein
MLVYYLLILTVQQTVDFISPFQQSSAIIPLKGGLSSAGLAGQIMSCHKKGEEYP